MNGSELHCVDVVELVTEYLEGTLDEATMQRFEEHIERECPGCRAYLEQMRQTRDAAGTLAEPEPLPEETRAGLLAAFRDRRV